MLKKIKDFFAPSPAKSTGKQRARIANYARHGASYSKKSLLGWMTSGRGPDEDICDNLPTLRNRSRDLYMGAPLATGALKTVRTNVVGSGLMLNPQPDIDFLGLTEEQGEEFRASVVRHLM